MYILYRILFFLISTSALADSVHCFNEDTSFKIYVPKGWKAVYESDLSPCAFFVPSQFNFKTTGVRFYPNLVPTDESISNFIDEDLQDYLKRYPQMKSQSLPDYKNKGGLTFILKRVSGGNPPFVEEVVAYLKSRSAVLIVVLSAKDKSKLKTNEAIFREYLNEIVTNPKKLLFEELKTDAIKLEKSKFEGDFVSAYLSAIGSKMGEAAGKCLKSPNFSFGQIFQVDAQGKIITWINETDSTEAKCIHDELFGLRGPKPPLEPFPIYVQWNSK